MTPSCLSLRPTSARLAAAASRLKAGAAVALLAWCGGQPALAQPASDESWTGRPQDATAARKEASAALVEGRRECARQPAAERSACLKLVQDEYNAAMKRLGQSPAKRQP